MHGVFTMSRHVCMSSIQDNGQDQPENMQPVPILLLPTAVIRQGIFGALQVTPAPNDIGGNPTSLWTFGKHQQKVQLTSAAFNEMWDGMLVRECGDGQWIFVQYCEHAVIFEQFRMKINSGFFEQVKKDHRVAVVPFDWGMARLTGEWMLKQVQIIEKKIGEIREVLEILGELARIGRRGRERILRTSAHTMSADMDTTVPPLRPDFLVVLEVLEGNLVTPLLRDPSYATLIDVLGAILPAGWKYCEYEWWAKGV